MNQDLKAMGTSSIKNFFSRHSQSIAFVLLIGMLTYIIFFKNG